MKKLIHTIPHLADLLSEQVTVWVVDDASKLSSENIFSSTEVDDYSYLSDDELANLDKQALATISDIETVDRLCQIDRNLLTADQKSILSKYFSDTKNRIVIDQEDVKAIITKLQNVSVVFLTPSAKNSQFRSTYTTTAGEEIDTDVIKDILHQLKVSDYRYNLKSREIQYLGNNLIVLEPAHNFKLRQLGAIVRNLRLYIKVDLTLSGSSNVLVSFHRAEFIDPEVYSD